MSDFRSTALFQLIQTRPLRKFSDPWLFKAVIVTALGATLLVRIETEGMCSVFFDLLFIWSEIT